MDDNTGDSENTWLPPWEPEQGELTPWTDFWTDNTTAPKNISSGWLSVNPPTNSFIEELAVKIVDQFDAAVEQYNGEAYQFSVDITLSGDEYTTFMSLLTLCDYRPNEVSVDVLEAYMTYEMGHINILIQN